MFFSSICVDRGWGVIVHGIGVNLLGIMIFGRDAIAPVFPLFLIFYLESLPSMN